MKITAVRYHDISCGHRVVGHEGKCVNLHGHNYRVWFHCEGELDSVGRVIDFGVIKSHLCMWLEDNWDHRMIIWNEDPMLFHLKELDSNVRNVPFNPTAENIAQYLLTFICPLQLEGTGVTCTKIVIEETRKCHAAVEL